MILQQIQMNSPTPDFHETHFPHPELDRVHGQPTIDRTLKVYKQLKQNTEQRFQLP